MTERVEVVVVVVGGSTVKCGQEVMKNTFKKASWDEDMVFSSCTSLKFGSNKDCPLFAKESLL